ncbi:phosphoadenylyl-sulfate reductase [Acuticoccus sp. MNP-M23]|uniref:phosphoadenylyl-sulfate reductase n=1 Tax=Acuticoccus sp. MNP-M23 TaxID=3072793 RepID=UPI0028151753|nr:phosphoadenylyl-sulfate reductase [Acuticoccus sp. MNP-M23]WMS43993.1 phosphoadenylyl-sulfate reductase [Acuticoccus sp. MNP-M23]
MLDIPGRTSSAVGALDRMFGALPPKDVLALSIRDLFPGRIAVVSSFGADSIALLNLVAEVDPSTPVLFLETGKHFEATLRYRDMVAEKLGLTNVIDLVPSAEALAQKDPDGLLHAREPDACCAIRKVAPLYEALSGYDAWITGRRRDQTFLRNRMEVFEADGARTKINPLADWSQDDIDTYIWRLELPRNPLVDESYASIGCAPCTAKVAPGEDVRAGRWRGTDKIECGIHGAT